MPDITTHASAQVEEIAEEPVEFEAPQFERIEIPEPVKPEVEIPAVEEIVDILVAEETTETVAEFSEPEFEVINTTPVDDFKAPVFALLFPVKEASDE